MNIKQIKKARTLFENIDNSFGQLQVAIDDKSNELTYSQTHVIKVSGITVDQFDFMIELLDNEWGGHNSFEYELADNIHVKVILD